MPQYKKILLPFRSEASLISLLDSALEMAQAHQAELYLVGYGQCFDGGDQRGTRRIGTDQEDVLVRMKGLQARLQALPASVHLDSTPLKSDRQLKAYADARSIDLIVWPESQGIESEEVRLAKILVPLDGSELAESALPVAVRLALASKAEITLLQAVAPLPATIKPAIHHRLTQSLREETTSYLATMQEKVATTDLRVGVALVEGPAPATIVNYATDHEFDLIIMCSHGRSGLGRMVLGSVAEEVMRRATCPTLVLRSQISAATAEFNQVLVPLDGSALAEQALAPVICLSRAAASDRAIIPEVHLLRVTEPIHQFGETVLVSQVVAHLEADERRDAMAYLCRLRASLEEESLEVRVAVETGPVAGHIVDYARAHQIDLIAMSSHGRSGFKRWTQGSVAEQVLHGTDCATLVVHGHDQVILEGACHDDLSN